MAREVILCESFAQFPSGSSLWTQRGMSSGFATMQVAQLDNRYAITPGNAKIFFPAAKRFVGGFRAFRASAMDYTVLCNLQNTNSAHLTVSYDVDGAVWATRVNTALPRSPAGVFLYNAWNTILWDLYIHDSAGFLKVVVNGVVVAEASGVNTKASSYDTANAFGTINPNSYADLWMVKDDADLTNPWSGTPALLPYAIWGHFPNADGSQNDFTASGAANRFECVDEQAMDSDTTHVEGGTLGNKQSFSFPALPQNASAPAIVQFAHEIRKTDASDRQAQIGTISGGSEYVGAAFNAPDSYGWKASAYLSDPKTGLAWVKADAEAAQALIQVAN